MVAGPSFRRSTRELSKLRAGLTTASPPPPSRPAAAPPSEAGEAPPPPAGPEAGAGAALPGGELLPATEAVVEFARAVQSVFVREPKPKWRDLPHFGALCLDFPGALRPAGPVRLPQRGERMNASRSEARVRQWLEEEPDTNFLWMRNPNDHKPKPHHPEAVLTRVAAEAIRAGWRRGGLRPGGVLLYSHVCPCAACAERIVEFQQLVPRPLTVCVAMPWKSHVYEAVSGSSDRLVYQRLRREGIRVVQLPLSLTWSPQRIQHYYRRQHKRRRGQWRRLGKATPRRRTGTGLGSPTQPDAGSIVSTVDESVDPGDEESPQA